MKHKPSSTWILLPACAALFAAGWWLGHLKRSASHGNQAAATQARPSATLSPTASNLPPLQCLADFQFPNLPNAAACRAYLKQDTDTIQNHLVRETLRRYAIQKWLEMDAEDALTVAEAETGNSMWGPYNALATEIFDVWIGLNQASALEAFGKASPSLQGALRAQIVASLSEVDTPRALAMWEKQIADNKGNHMFYDSMSAHLLASLAAKHPELLQQKITASPEDVKLLGAWFTVGPSAALAHVRTLGKNADKLLLETKMLGQLIREDQTAALELLQRSKTYPIANAAKQAVKADLSAALELARTLGAQGEKVFLTNVLLAGARELSTGDPARSLELFREAESIAQPGGALDGSVGRLDVQYIKKDAVAALTAQDPTKAWAMLQEDPSLASGGGLAGYFMHQLRSDEAAAISQLRTLLDDPKSATSATEAAMMAYRWGHGAGIHDPTALFTALPQLTEAVDADVLDTWLRSNPYAAAEFLATHSDSPKFKPEALAKEGVIQQLATTMPDFTAQWIGSLTNVGLQNDAAKQLGSHWGAFDPTAAQAWIDSLPTGATRQAAETGFSNRNAER
jgi:hypothetical protein